jgi:hypothetical protein
VTEWTEFRGCPRLLFGRVNGALSRRLPAQRCKSSVFPDFFARRGKTAIKYA